MTGIAIRYLKREEVDETRWDECIFRNANGLIYAQSIYLDTMADNWDALVIGDYEAVMPLPRRKKWGISYYYKPAFIQQLGIVGEVLPQTYGEIMNHLFRNIKYGSLQLNYSNTGMSAFGETASLINMIIDLSGDYDTIKSEYAADVRNYSKKALRERMIYVRSADVGEAIEVFRQHYGKRINSVKENDYSRFTALSVQLMRGEMAFVRKVVGEDGTLLAVALFLKDNKRIYNMINASTAMGREKKANYYLLDEVIREFSGNPLIFDMEGSDLEGVRNFYRKFGGRDQPYFYLHYNHLPWLPGLLRS